MTESLIIIIGLILHGIGIMGCIVPGIPGPLVSFSSLFLFYLLPGEEVGLFALIIWGLFAAVAAGLDLVVPVLGAKRFGSSREGIIGGIIGIFVGLFFFPPLGIILGPLVGTVAGDMIAGGNFSKALNSGMGSLIGFLVGTSIKLVYCIIVLIFFFGKVGATVIEAISEWV
ncbi:MAG: hypothetical protein ACI85F_001166 [Bacteroidia bacterium]|jgi:uncharacterized protein YqgC (DUF456 family)